MRDALWLVKHNIPFDVAFALDDTWRTAWAIVMSEFESGRRFNWRTWEFEGK